jgi:hypothetical protein
LDGLSGAHIVCTRYTLNVAPFVVGVNLVVKIFEYASSLQPSNSPLRLFNLLA